MVAELKNVALTVHGMICKVLKTFDKLLSMQIMMKTSTEKNTPPPPSIFHHKLLTLVVYTELPTVIQFILLTLLILKRVVTCECRLNTGLDLEGSLFKTYHLAITH